MTGLDGSTVGLNHKGTKDTKTHEDCRLQINNCSSVIAEHGIEYAYSHLLFVSFVPLWLDLGWN
jgi:hypothetical protein